MDRGAWQASPWSRTESDMAEHTQARAEAQEEEVAPGDINKVRYLPRPL